MRLRFMSMQPHTQWLPEMLQGKMILSKSSALCLGPSLLTFACDEGKGWRWGERGGEVASEGRTSTEREERKKRMETQKGVRPIEAPARTLRVQRCTEA